VVAEYVAARLGLERGELLPDLAGRVSLSIALAAYGRWLDDDDSSLEELLGQAVRGVSTLFGE